MKLGAALAAVISIILVLAAASQTARPPALLTYSAGEPLLAPGGLCIAKPNGTRGHRLLAGRKDDRESAWSPGGKYVAFTRYPERTRGGAISEIYVADARGRIVRNLTRAIRGRQAINAHPSWSPNGRRIAFESGYHGSIIYIADRNGEDIFQGEIFGEDPQWARNGRIVFTRHSSYPPGSSIYTADLPSGTHERLLIDEADQPSLSRDGGRIAFVRSLDIWVADADGTDAKPLITSAKAETNPAWSPDAKRIAFERRDTSGSNPSSVVVATDTGQELAVVRGSSGAYAPSWRPAVTLPRASRPGCD